MKTLPCYIFLATFSGIAVLAASACLGAALSYLEIAAYLIGYACAVGLLALACTDRPRRSARYAAHVRAMQVAYELAAVRRRNAVCEPAWDHPVPAADRALATLGAGHDSATVSVM